MKEFANVDNVGRCVGGMVEKETILSSKIFAGSCCRHACFCLGSHSFRGQLAMKSGPMELSKARGSERENG